METRGSTQKGRRQNDKIRGYLTQALENSLTSLKHEIDRIKYIKKIAD